LKLAEFFEKPNVNIGNDYQAILPAFEEKFIEDRRLYETLLWKPNVIEDERQLARYIDLVKSSAIPMGIHTIESALKILMESQGEIHVAVLKLLQSNDKSLEKRWTQIEIEQFLKGLEKHGKDFTSIARDILNKTSGDCVQLYYFWKKLCNEYKSTHLPQSRECNFPANNKYNHNNNAINRDNFFDDVDNGHNNGNSVMIQNGNGISHNIVNASHSTELRPHVCEVPDCSAVS
jgi:Myb-like DNA-binding domain/ELM2 domain